ncbi:MAG: hypothetical protein K0R41_3313 [Geminicoccaceae bacterium]|jgi:hypothetical protein|nr:hypothetical protein [Geminicoccaceae bacterium]MCE3249488.1 hypothetical protein [Geminicoccaceae bacterium]
MRSIRRALAIGLVGALLGPAQLLLAEDEDIETEERILEQQLDNAQSRVLRNSPRPIERSQLSRDLGASEQGLRSLKTREPGAASVPLLERQLDRLSRPARVRSPGSSGLLRTD